ncbi:hypothetical protein RvY_06814 [Ramazzottius varieornatus]|uniref:Uncharacterized protein n=1 Tax=Ramazzottius varieornatus TaxID=947166 RepID=A0A1D1UZW2_RAMVA|nr:hypothetical protein RvY_06814 [Ramazzottius varieornatus]
MSRAIPIQKCCSAHKATPPPEPFDNQSHLTVTMKAQVVDIHRARRVPRSLLLVAGAILFVSLAAPVLRCGIGSSEICRPNGLQDLVNFMNGSADDERVD